MVTDHQIKECENGIKFLKEYINISKMIHSIEHERENKVNCDIYKYLSSVDDKDTNIVVVNLDSYLRTYMKSPDNIINSSSISIEFITEKLKDHALINPLKGFKLNISALESVFSSFYIQFIKRQKSIRYHKGFYKMMEKYNIDLLESIDTTKRNRVVLISFGMDSIIAKICHLNFVLKHPEYADYIESYNYSTPNVGNKACEKIFELFQRKSTIRTMHSYNIDDDYMYNILSKHLGFRYPFSTLLIKKNSEKKRIYTPEDYLKALEEKLKEYKSLKY